MTARAILVAVLGTLALLLAARGIGVAPDGWSQQPPSSARYTDKRLYRDIAAEVADGVPYHEAATRLQRSHGYPLKPGITVRLPTLAFAGAAIGWDALRAAALALLAATAAAWFVALRGKATLAERLAAAALVAGGTGMLLAPDPLVLHERWAGLFLGLALALRIGRRERWLPVLLAASAALALRELALPFALLALVFACWEKRRREALGWTALAAMFAALLALHLELVAAQVRPGDLPSPGWSAFGGLPAVLASIVKTSPLQYLPLPLAVVLAVLPLPGWLGLGDRSGLFCLTLFAGYAAMFALFARPDNFYWGAVVQPAWFVGLAFLPRASIRGWRALRRSLTRAGNLAGADAPL